MNQSVARSEIVERLQKEILSMQGVKKARTSNANDTGLGPIINAFPTKTFPIGAVHEFISHGAENAAATSGFMIALAGRLMPSQHNCLWISTKRTLFPPALKQFGLDATRVIFLDLLKQKDVLWAVEEALKCQSLSFVIGEIGELNFKESRRLQLAVEHNHVTGLLHRSNPRTENTVACLTRWKIATLPSHMDGVIPGIGFSRWRVELAKVRNGRPGIWDLEWSRRGFQSLTTQRAAPHQNPKRKTA